MKDIFKSKWMIAFIVLMLVITYINACCLEQKNASAVNTDKMQLNKQITSRL